MDRERKNPRYAFGLLSKKKTRTFLMDKRDKIKAKLVNNAKIKKEYYAQLKREKKSSKASPAVQSDVFEENIEKKEQPKKQKLIALPTILQQKVPFKKISNNRQIADSERKMDRVLLSKKTKKGQPVMANRMNYLLKKLTSV